jgi:hypothetical protein
MIGVISKPQEREVVEEFFQLFKTPWEFYNPSGRYDVILTTRGNIPESEAPLIVSYDTEKSGSDGCLEPEAVIQGSKVSVTWGDACLPIYGKAVTFSNPGHPFLICKESGRAIAYEIRKEEQRILRIGYDLFEEVLYLLSEGQPPENALIPTLDLHIEMLRNWIVESEIPLTEIPPTPEGYSFIACLTHDVDFVAIRNHILDHSMLGFLYRATVGSLNDVITRKAGLLRLFENLKAVCSLPFVFLGIYQDPWNQFNRYLELEKGVRSTYFLIPFKKRAGQGFSKGRLKRRATKYDIQDVGDTIEKLLSHGCEIGVHGIDAWHSIESGQGELQRIKEKATFQDGIGIRIHWLSSNQQTFVVLDKAGYSYDSSFGYNETVGFKAGTTQVYKPLGARLLLEVPLHIQDTALFGHGRMNMSDTHAEQLCDQIIERVMRHEGVLTILWHQRSLGPERLWGGFYEKLLKKLREKNAWFATGGEVADWFRMRRQASFEVSGTDTESVRVTFALNRKEKGPQLTVRSYKQNSCSIFESRPITI